MLQAAFSSSHPQEHNSIRIDGIASLEVRGERIPLLAFSFKIAWCTPVYVMSASHQCLDFCLEVQLFYAAIYNKRQNAASGVISPSLSPERMTETAT